MLTDAEYKQALRVPHAEAGMTVGLFGGSFNPPHDGHLLVSRHALTRVGLDQVWWLVTPGNPLKDPGNLLPLRKRIDLCQMLADHPRIKITGLEQTLGTRFTADTLHMLASMRPRLRFVWLMGADNLKSFHLWENWQRIAGMMPIVVVDRPGSTLSYRNSKAARYLAQYRRKSEHIHDIGMLKAPAWVFIHGPRSGQSSTAIRDHASG